MALPQPAMCLAVFLDHQLVYHCRWHQLVVDSIGFESPLQFGLFVRTSNFYYLVSRHRRV